MDEQAPADAWTMQRAGAPPWTESGLWLLWGFLSCGLLVGVGFLWIGVRYKRRDWQRWAAVYGAAGAVALFVNGSGWLDVVGPTVWSVLLAGLIHSVVVQTRHPRRLPYPRPMIPVTYARPPVWPYPQASYQGAPPPWPYPPVASTPPAQTEPWAGFVRSAEAARERFRRCVGRLQPGPLRDAVHDLGARIDSSIAECRRIAAGGRVLAEARAAIDSAALDRALRDATARQVAEPDDPLAMSTVVALQSQRATAGRMDEVIEDTVNQLRLLDARLGEAVVRMLELSAQAEVAPSMPQLSSDVDTLLTDLEALRLAVEETHAVDVLGAPLPGGLPAPGPRPGPPAGGAVGWDEPE